MFTLDTRSMQLHVAILCIYMPILVFLSIDLIKKLTLLRKFQIETCSCLTESVVINIAYTDAVYLFINPAN